MGATMTAEHDYETIATIKVLRDKRDSKYGAITEFGLHIEGLGDHDTIDALMARVAEVIRQELRTRPTQDELPAVDPHSAPRAFVS